MNTRWLMIKQLDEQLKDWQAANNKSGRPRHGWVKTIRQALSMSAEQLAKRLGLSRARVTQLENAEINDSLTLRTLKETANAMECEFIYAIVPKNNSSLENIITTRAKIVANDRIENVSHTMALENQPVNNTFAKHQKNELIHLLTEHLNKKLWTDRDSDSHNNRFKKLIENLPKKK